MDNVAFCACSYLRKTSGPRARMIRGAFESWRDFLRLPFKEKIFLDDRSPDFGALHVLAEASALESFSEVRYQTIPHAAHSNFGIVACLELASTPYIIHLDDDVYVTEDADKCLDYIKGMIAIMEKDPTVMGGNLIGVDPSRHAAEWLPGEIYEKAPSWHHPAKYFGTGACIMRRELLQRVSFAQILQWGANQPAFWEKLVTQTPREFITGPDKTPFNSLESAFFDSATADRTLRDRFWFQYNLFKKCHPGIAKLIASRKRLSAAPPSKD